MNTTVIIESLSCGNCHVVFGLDEHFHASVQRTGKSFYCPNGHYIRYSDNEVKQLKEEKERLERRLASAAGNAKYYEERYEATKRQKAAVKGQLTKARNRIANGVCPCCSRTFQNVVRHMQSQHPEFTAQLHHDFICDGKKGCGKGFDSSRGLNIHRGQKGH